MTVTNNLFFPALIAGSLAACESPANYLEVDGGADLEEAAEMPATLETPAAIDPQTINALSIDESARDIFTNKEASPVDLNLSADAGDVRLSPWPATDHATRSIAADVSAVQSDVPLANWKFLAGIGLVSFLGWSWIANQQREVEKLKAQVRDVFQTYSDLYEQVNNSLNQLTNTDSARSYRSDLVDKANQIAAKLHEYLRQGGFSENQTQKMLGILSAPDAVEDRVLEEVVEEIYNASTPPAADKGVILSACRVVNALKRVVRTLDKTKTELSNQLKEYEENLGGKKYFKKNSQARIVNRPVSLAKDLHVVRYWAPLIIAHQKKITENLTGFHATLQRLQDKAPIDFTDIFGSLMSILDSKQ